MWKKDEETNTPQSGAHTSDSTRKTTPPATRSDAREPATIGPSITIKGEVSGDEDLLIQGRVDGSVDLEDQSVTVGPEGRVKADITGRVVTVEGEVEGDLEADEQVVLRSSARVVGDITAPRVVLEDGARFRGLVDMGDAADKKKPRTESSSSSSGKSSGTASGSSASPSSASSSKASSSSSSSSSSGSSNNGKESTSKDLEKATS